MFIAQHIERSYAIEVAAPIDAVFPLFEPLGERAWVHGWEPTMLYPPSGAAQVGTVFTTDAAGEATTLWSIADYDAKRHYVRYARVTPGSRFGWVEVRCSAAATDNTKVHVAYRFTALSEAGNAYLEAMTEEAFAAYIESWQMALAAYLEAQTVTA